MLDNKVIVCQSTLCVITNIRKVKLGMKVAINNVHTIKLKSLRKIGMILCARGRLDVLEDQGNPSHNFLIWPFPRFFLLASFAF